VDGIHRDGTDQELAMTDKSSHSSTSKKSAESIKERRAKRKDKVDRTSQMERLTNEKKP
jgi:hypothetical protein